MDYIEANRELNALLRLVKDSTATLEDARKKLTQPIEDEKIKAKEEIEKYRKAVEAELEEKRQQLVLEIDNLGMGGTKTELTQIAVEKSQGFPWLVKAYHDYFKLKDQRLASFLETKTHPALIAAEELRQISKERREAEQAARLATYLLDYSRYLAPWLDEYIGVEAEELDVLIRDIHSSWEKKEQEFDEEVERHFGPRFNTLSQSEKLQRKLDWYWSKPKKSDWQIGRDYERYIGYLYEKDGWDVYYHGKMGFEDLGRDLVCKKNGIVEIVQCTAFGARQRRHRDRCEHV